MKGTNLCKLIGLGLLLSSYACTNESVKDISPQTVEVSFAVVTPDGSDQTKAVGDPLKDRPWDDFITCANGFDEFGVPIQTEIREMRAHIKLSKTIDPTPEHPGQKEMEVIIKLISRENNLFITEPITVDANTEYTITDFLVHSPEENNPTVYFSGVKEGAELSPYVDHVLPYKFTTAAYEKQTFNFSVMCARGVEPARFGKPKFDINQVEVFCLPVFVDVCDQYGEDFVATGTVSIKKITQKEEPQYADFNDLTPVTDELKSGIISYLCFSDNLIENDAEEWFLIELSYQNPNNVDEIIRSHEITSLQIVNRYCYMPAWNKDYHFFDITICKNDFCIFTCQKD